MPTMVSTTLQVQQMSPVVIPGIVLLAGAGPNSFEDLWRLLADMHLVNGRLSSLISQITSDMRQAVKKQEERRTTTAC